MPKCPFCSRPGDIIRNTFYERDGWFAFLDGNPITRGHTILAKRQLPAWGSSPIFRFAPPAPRAPSELAGDNGLSTLADIHLLVLHDNKSLRESGDDIRAFAAGFQSDSRRHRRDGRPSRPLPVVGRRPILLLPLKKKLAERARLKRCYRHLPRALDSQAVHLLWVSLALRTFDVEDTRSPGKDGHERLDTCPAVRLDGDSDFR
jgi:hypothetical protein